VQRPVAENERGANAVAWRISSNNVTRDGRVSALAVEPLLKYAMIRAQELLLALYKRDLA
jgi:hypothetical protein